MAEPQTPRMPKVPPPPQPPEITGRPPGMSDFEYKQHELTFGEKCKWTVVRDPITGAVVGYNIIETGIGSPSNQTGHHIKAKQLADDKERSRMIKLMQEETILETLKAKLARDLKGIKDSDED